MAKSNRKQLLPLLLAVIVLLVSWMPISQCAKKAVGVARKEDIPYIKCQVCQKLAAQLHQLVQAKQAEISPKKISEYQIIEIAENVCNLKKQEADWILRIDIVEKGDKLELVEQESEGQCNSECKTIERACQECYSRHAVKMSKDLNLDVEEGTVKVLGYSDTDVAEYLYKKKPQLNAFVNFVCKDLTEACSSTPPPVPKGRTPGEPFVPKSAKEAEMEKLMKSMEGMPGAPGMKMYSREDLMNQKYGDEDAEDDDDDDDEASFSSKLGKAMREKESKKYDWKETMIKGVVDAAEKLKGHAESVSNRVTQWWKSKKTNWQKSSTPGKAEL